MNIFFFTTTLAVVAIGLVVFLIALKLWKILGHVERILSIATKETEQIKEDLDDFRADVRRRGFSFLSLADLIGSIAGRHSKHAKRHDTAE